MKRTQTVCKFLAGLALLISCGVMGCRKTGDSPSLASKQYILYNYSSGSSVQAGSFVIRELADGNCSLTISLADGYKVPGVTLKTYIVTPESTGGGQFIYADLGNLDGGSGQATRNPVITNSDNRSVKYTSLVAQKTYQVKVLNGSNVQAIGPIQ